MKFRLLSILLCTALATSTALAAGTGTDAQNAQPNYSIMKMVSGVVIGGEKSDGFSGFSVSIDQVGPMFKLAELHNSFYNEIITAAPVFSLYFGQSTSTDDSKAYQFFKTTGLDEKLGQLQEYHLGITLGAGITAALFSGGTMTVSAGVYVEKRGAGCSKVDGNCDPNNVSALQNLKTAYKSITNNDEYNAYNQWASRPSVDAGMFIGLNMGYSFANTEDHDTGGFYLGLSAKMFKSAKDDSMPVRMDFGGMIGYASYY